MIRRSTWIMLGLFALSLSAAVLWNRFKPSAEEGNEAEPTPQPFWTATSSDLTGFRVEETGTGNVVDVRRDAESAWLILEPDGALADLARIERAASWLASPQPRAALPGTGDLAPFGLSEPRARVTIFTIDGTSRGFTVGKEVPTGGATYTLVVGKQEVFLVNSVGLEEVLGLWQDLLPPTAMSTVEATSTSAGTPLPEESRTGLPEGTPAPSETADHTPTP